MIPNPSEKTCFSIVKSYGEKISQPIKTGISALHRITINWLNAKANPFCDPPGWKQEKTISQNRVKRLEVITSHAEKQKKALATKSPQSNESSDSEEITSQEEGNPKETDPKKIGKSPQKKHARSHSANKHAKKAEGVQKNAANFKDK